MRVLFLIFKLCGCFSWRRRYSLLRGVELDAVRMSATHRTARAVLSRTHDTPGIWGVQRILWPRRRGREWRGTRTREDPRDVPGGVFRPGLRHLKAAPCKAGEIK